MKGVGSKQLTHTRPRMHCGTWSQHPVWQNSKSGIGNSRRYVLIVSTATPKEGRTTCYRQEAQTSFATCALDSVLSPGSSAQCVDDGRGARRAQGVTELARGPCGAACAVELVYNPTRSRPARARAQICHADGALTVASAVSWTSKRPAPFVKVEAACF
ncbi:hypothetical protein B0H14DRAFT_2666333 [Mycena olivaceomarginata]|nr:hypothetical protein B0H14DRAFT_2666333 [Mycena olivaceomarginata]